MKKIILTTLVCCLLTSSTVFASEYKEFMSEGNIDYTTTLQTGKENDTVTIIAVDNGTDIFNENNWLIGYDDKIKNFTTAPLKYDKSVEIAIYLEDNGIYDIYTIIDGEKSSNKIKYVNKHNYEVMAETIAGRNKDEIVNALTNKSMEMGMFDDEEVYQFALENADFQNVAQLTIDANPTEDNAIQLLNKALIIDLLNNLKITNVERFAKIIYPFDSIQQKYVENRTNCLNNLTGKTYTSIKNFDDALNSIIILDTINRNDGIGTVTNILLDYAQFISIDKSKVTNQMAVDMLKKTPFNTIKSVADFVNSYKDSGNGGGQGGGSPIGTPIPYTSNSNPPKSSDLIGQTNSLKIFDDIDNYPWAEEAIISLYNMGIVSGKSFGKFEPQSNVTRAEIVKMVISAFNLNLIGQELPFNDVNENDWCYPYIRSAFIAGAVKGINDSEFGTNQYVTRQDICVIANNLFESCKINLEDKTEKFNFMDENQIADYAKVAVEKMQQNGIVKGNETGNFNPRGNASRAEAAQIIYGITKLLK